MLDSRLIHVIAVGRTGSFTAAAESVGVTQSAVTRSIADLERQIGYAVFHRTPRGAIPTEDGKAFLDRASRLLDDAKVLLRRSSGVTDPYAGALRIGVAPASLEWQLVDAAEALLGRHPGIRLDVTGSTFERIVHFLRNGVIDVALGFDEAFSGWPEFDRRPIGATESTLFVRKGHPLLEIPAPTHEDLARYDFVCPSDSKPYGAPIREIYENAGMSWQQKVHLVDFVPLMARIVAKTGAIGMVNRAYGQSASFQRNFATLEHPDFFPPAELCCAIRKHRDMTPGVRALMSALREAVARRG
jgi:DNA-binding transcriptional LysR family regulator